MFWLLSLLFPSLRRQSPGEPFNDLGVMLRSPQSRSLLFQILGLIGAVLLIWALIGVILSLFNAWFVVVLTLILGGVVGYREWHQRRRDSWILHGCCAECGYDLRATPTRCPECGRDALLDEPIWRRMRRELEAKLATKEVTEKATIPQPVVDAPGPKVRLAMRTPDPADDQPIPLEPAPGDLSPVPQTPVCRDRS